MTSADELRDERLADWVGRETEEQDVVAPGPVRGLVASLHSQLVTPQPGEPTPLLAHWLYFLPYTPAAETGSDGHPRRGGFLPPVPLPRRMWAGSDITFHRPLAIGAEVVRRSRIADVSEKHSRTGALIFVRVDHEVRDGDGPVVSERQTIVYRDLPAGAPPPPQPAPANTQWRRQIEPDPVLLFRYSALTFNGHRIHYDRSYATGEEGYPGLVVHGPLIATLLLHELVARHPGANVAAYSFRAIRPIFDIAPFDICGSLDGAGKAALFAAGPDGALCMSATATLR
jgi:3-methylfumaryl-CoA hydratase